MTVLEARDPRGRGPRAVAELRAGRIAGALAFLGLLLTFGGVTLSAAAARDPGGAGTLEVFLLEQDRQLIAAILRCLALLLTLPLIFFLQRAMLARDQSTPRHLVTIGMLASVSIAAATLLGWGAVRQAAHSLADGAVTSERAALDATWELAVVRWMDIVSRILFATWLVLASLRASRVGLLTPFLGMWGVVAGVTGTFLAIGDALYIGWVASVAALAAGYWPGGRPPSWSTGRAEPWTPGPAALGERSTRT